MCGQNGEPGVPVARNATMVYSGETEPAPHQRQIVLVMLLKTEYVTLKPAQVRNKARKFVIHFCITFI